LRQDEIDRRAGSYTETLRTYRENLRVARQRLYDAQQNATILSGEQFNERVNSLEETRRKMRDLRGEAEKLALEQHTLMDRLDITPSLAAVAMKLSADPYFTKALTEYADSANAVAAQQKWLGAKNPALVREIGRRDAALGTLAQVAAKAGVNAREQMPQLILLFNTKAREELIKQLVTNEALIQGKFGEVELLTRAIADQDKALKDANTSLARIEELKKDLMVADAVFSSAVARLDTNKADVFVSYPLVQLLAEPELPKQRSSPRLLFGFLGGLAGTILAIMAWGMLWVRQKFADKLKRRLRASSMPRRAELV
jgi:uncharacterized protein involved in exopolysaccharide biosynthesis